MGNATRAKAEADHLLALDGMRGLAAIAVVAFHSHWITGRQVAPGSYLAVDFFFALSGFVLALASERWLSAELGAWGMMRKRIIRLYPIYLLGTVIGIVFAAAPLIAHHSGLLSLMMSALPSLFYIPLYLGPMSNASNQLFPFDGPSWSLFFEMIANAVFIWIVLSRQRWLEAVLALISVVALIYFGLQYGNLDGGSTTATFAVGLARVGFSFFVGALLYGRWRAQGRPRSLPPWLLLIPVVLVGVVFFTPPSAVKDLLAALFLFPATIYLGASVRLPSWLTPAAQFSGHASYPLYVLHMPALGLAGTAWVHLSKESLQSFPISLLVVAGAVLIIASAWLDRYAQPTFARWLSTVLPERPAATPSTSTPGAV